jgi:hypothetical protein
VSVPLVALIDALARCLVPVVTARAVTTGIVSRPLPGQYGDAPRQSDDPRGADRPDVLLLQAAAGLIGLSVVAGR